jgi:hypothetical protein
LTSLIPEQEMDREALMINQRKHGSWMNVGCIDVHDMSHVGSSLTSLPEPQTWSAAQLHDVTCKCHKIASKSQPSVFELFMITFRALSTRSPQRQMHYKQFTCNSLVFYRLKAYNKKGTQIGQNAKQFNVPFRKLS